jgi:serine/threonine protein kinase/WD40 repeat protein
MSEQDQREETVFEAALHLPPAHRDEYLDQACKQDPALRQRVTKLLSALDRAKDFLNEPAVAGPMKTQLVLPPEISQAGQIIGHYKLLQQLGEGGCGIVYMAEQEEPVQRRVALKIIKPGMDSKSVIARFDAERQALAMMDHPNIAKFFDAGVTEKGRLYFVMELVRGNRITEYCDQNDLATEARLDLFIQICRAVQHAHQKGVIHRDLKPSNILVTLHDGVPVPKVIDFGIAKATQGRLTDQTLFTAFEQFIGTPAYMSPEQAEMSGLDVDTRSDIYSLGVLLYELLTGKTPFDAKELLSAGLDVMRHTIREREPIRPSTRLSTMVAADLATAAKHRGTEAPKLIHRLRGDLDWIVMKCLEKDRTRRYETANGVAMDIRRHLNNEPVAARPPSAAYKFQKAFRRNKLVFTAGSAVAAALLVGISISTWQTVIARRALLQVEAARSSERQQRLAAQSAQRIAQTAQQRADAQAKRATENQAQSRRLLYDSDMNLAQQALKLNNLGKVRRLLDRHRPGPGEEDLRGWEWRYLWQQTRSSALATLTNRSSPAFSVSFSRDGRQLAIGWFDGRVDLWDLEDRRWARALTDRAYSYQGRVAFSPVGNYLAATSEPKVVKLYDLDSGRDSILWRAPNQGDWEVRDIAFSQDGSLAVIYAGLPTSFYARSYAGLADSAWVVETRSGKTLSLHQADLSAVFHFGAARLSPDGRRLYLARADSSKYRYSIQCIDLSTDREVWQTEPQRDYGLTALAISPDGQQLASGSGFEDPAIRIWDTATGRPLFRLEGHTGWVSALAFSKDGRRLISAAGDQSIRIWDARTWTEIQVLRGHEEDIYSIAFSDQAQRIASAGRDGAIMLWRANGKGAADGYSRLPEGLRVDQVLPLNQSLVLLLPPDKAPALFDLKNRFAFGPDALPGIRSSADVLGFFGTNTLCHWDETNQVVVQEWSDGNLVRRSALTLDPPHRPIGFAYDPERQRLAWTESASANSVFVASLATPGRRVELKADVGGLLPLSFSEDGEFLVAVVTGQEALHAWGAVRVFKAETGRVVASINGLIREAKLALGGRILAASVKLGNDHEIQFYDLLHPEAPPRRVSGKGDAISLAVSPDGTVVAISTNGGEVKLYQAAHGELIESMHGHLGAVFGLAFSPDGRRLISTSGGREAVKLWDVGTRQELLTLPGTGSLLLAAAWSSDGNVILAGQPWQAWTAPSWDEIAAADQVTHERGGLP